MKMNGNIKKINDKIYLVNFHQVHMGWIPGLNLENTKADSPFTFLDNGTVFINTADADSMKFMEWMKAAMELSDSELGTDKGFYTSTRKMLSNCKKLKDEQIKKGLGDKLAVCQQVYKMSCEYEQTRRQLEKEYKKIHKFHVLNRLLERG